jgi:hypothetical protein
MSDLADIFLLSVSAMFNPSLLAAVTAMLLLPNAKRLMFGYLLGAYVTSMTVGLVIVFALHNSGVVSTSKKAISPAEDIVVGALLLLIALVLKTGRDQSLRQRREARRRAKQGDAAAKPSWPQRMLARGSPRVTFAVGIVLSFPGVSYLAALTKIDKLDAGTVPTVALVIGFCLIQQLLLELPLLGYVFAPERTERAVTQFRAWLARSGRKALIIGAAVIALVLIGRGLITLIN